MPRTIHLEPHHTADELKAHYRSSRDPVESRRWHLLWLVSQQMSLSDAAPVVGLNYEYARHVVKKYNRDGEAGLRNRRKNSRPYQNRRFLSAEQEAALAQRLESPPSDGGLWTGPKVAQEMARLTGRERVWPQRGWDYLNRLDYSLQEPRPQHRQSDPEAQATFKKTTGTRSHPSRTTSPESD
jgi:transposase